MARKIRILQLVNGFAIGGGEIKLLDLAKGLNRDKYEVYVASVGQSGPLENRFREAADDLVVFRKKFAFDFSLIYRVFRYTRERKIDLVQTTLPYADFIGPPAAKLAGVKHVISWETLSHGKDDPLRSKLRHHLAYRLAMKMVTKIVAVSGETRTSIIVNRKIPKKKIEVIYYGVDTDLFEPSPEKMLSIRKALHLSDKNIVLLTVARLEKVKGHSYLIKASKEIIQLFPSVRFVFAGDGNYRPHLEKMVEEYSISDYFRFLGFRKDVVNLLKMADIFVLPSVKEGLPNVLLEAMAVAKPIVATAVSGVPEIIFNGQNGYLVPAKDSEALKNSIIKLVESREVRKKMGNTGRRLVEKEFSLNKMIKDFENLYDYLYAN